MTFAQRVYWLVARIPAGRLMTYGDVALALGAPRAARIVGGALRHCPHPDQVPWQRVVNARGGISPREREHSVHRQALLLRAEGADIREDGPLYFLDLERYRWWPEAVLLAELDALADEPFVLADALPFVSDRPPPRRSRYSATNR